MPLENNDEFLALKRGLNEVSHICFFCLFPNHKTSASLVKLRLLLSRNEMKNYFKKDTWRCLVALGVFREERAQAKYSFLGLMDA